MPAKKQSPDAAQPDAKAAARPAAAKAAKAAKPAAKGDVKAKAKAKAAKKETLQTKDAADKEAPKPRGKQVKLPPRVEEAVKYAILTGTLNKVALDEQLRTAKSCIGAKILMEEWKLTEAQLDSIEARIDREVHAAAGPNAVAAAPAPSPKPSAATPLPTGATAAAAAATTSWNAVGPQVGLTAAGVASAGRLADSAIDDRDREVAARSAEEKKKQRKAIEMVSGYVDVRLSSGGARGQAEKGLVLLPSALQLLSFAFREAKPSIIKSWKAMAPRGYALGGDRLKDEKFQQRVQEEAEIIERYAPVQYIWLHEALRDEGDYRTQQLPITSADGKAYTSIKRLAAWAMAIDRFEEANFEAVIAGAMIAADALVDAEETLAAADAFQGLKSLGQLHGDAAAEKNTASAALTAVIAPPAAASSAPPRPAQQQHQSRAQQQPKSAAPVPAHTNTAREVAQLTRNRRRRQNLKAKAKGVGKQVTVPASQHPSLLPAPRAHVKAEAKH